jgi:hypothetical protein
MAHERAPGETHLFTLWLWREDLGAEQSEWRAWRPGRGSPLAPSDSQGRRLRSAIESTSNLGQPTRPP